MSEASYMNYYDKLYNLQDRVMAITEFRNSPFYLTGGTALSRFCLGHRYSDDLDFFTNEKIDLLTEVKKIIKSIINAGFKVEANNMSGTFARLFVSEDELNLKVDFVFEDLKYFGKTNSFDIFPRVDNIKNILINKITALTRYEAKDIADIWQICLNLSFEWAEVIENAREKELIDELMIVDILRSFPANMFSDIKWIKPIEHSDFENCRKVIIADIISRGKNTLCL